MPGKSNTADIVELSNDTVFDDSNSDLLIFEDHFSRTGNLEESIMKVAKKISSETIYKIAVIGKAGAGKSSLIGLLGGVDSDGNPPIEGHVEGTLAPKDYYKKSGETTVVTFTDFPGYCVKPYKKASNFINEFFGENSKYLNYHLVIIVTSDRMFEADQEVFQAVQAVLNQKEYETGYWAVRSHYENILKSINPDAEERKLYAQFEEEGVNEYTTFLLCTSKGWYNTYTSFPDIGPRLKNRYSHFIKMIENKNMHLLEAKEKHLMEVLKKIQEKHLFEQGQKADLIHKGSLIKTALGVVGIGIGGSIAFFVSGLGTGILIGAGTVVAVEGSKKLFTKLYGNSYEIKGLDCKAVKAVYGTEVAHKEDTLKKAATKNTGEVLTLAAEDISRYATKLMYPEFNFKNFWRLGTNLHKGIVESAGIAASCALEVVTGYYEMSSIKKEKQNQEIGVAARFEKVKARGVCNIAQSEELSSAGFIDIPLEQQQPAPREKTVVQRQKLRLMSSSME